ncbi:methionine--tRNA ligase, partial [Anaerobutyricum soehngenii]|nr:methionine--tRNA ligase [Anaerobutyricum soehngenii]
NKVTDKPEILFARLDAKEVQAKVEALNASKQTQEAEDETKDDEPVIDIEAKEESTFDDFEKRQFKVVELIACEDVKQTKTLLGSQVTEGSL